MPGRRPFVKLYDRLTNAEGCISGKEELGKQGIVIECGGDKSGYYLELWMDCGHTAVRASNYSSEYRDSKRTLTTADFRPAIVRKIVESITCTPAEVSPSLK